jgi:predicted  nucleic acid-binding Zn-ribbon protein
MLIEVERLGDAGFPLIEEVPAHPLVHMEGYNGIGKSLTIRLLQICTGRQTFSSERVWETFAAGLGRVRVRISGLAGANEIIWELDSRKWPGGLPDVEDSWFDLSIDSGQASLGQVRELLSVHRLAGDVGLAETLGQQVLADVRAFAVWHQPLTTGPSAPLEGTLALLDAAHLLVSRVDPERFLGSRLAADSANAELENKRGQLREAVGRQSALSQALALNQRVEEISRLGADVASQVADLDGKLALLTAVRGALRTELNELEDKAARSNEVRARLKVVQRRLDGHLAHLAAARLNLASLLERSLLETDSDIEMALSEARAELGRLVEQRAAIDAAPMLRSLLSDLRARLERAEREGLGVQVLVDESGFSVTALREQLEEREVQLANVGPSEEGRAVGDQMESVSSRIQAIEQVPSAQSGVARRLRLASTAEAEIKELLAATDESATGELEKLRERLSVVDERMSTLSMQRTVLMIRQEESASGRSPSEIEADLESLLKETGSTRKKLVKDAEAHQEVVRSLEAEFHLAQLTATDARRTAAEQEAELGRVVATLSDDPGFSWLQEAGISAGVNQPIDRQLEVVSQMSSRLAVAVERAGRLRPQLLGIEAAMLRLAGRLRGREESGGDEYVEEITRGYGEEFGAWFDDPIIRTELLPGARRVLRVDLNADRLDLEWETQNGGVANRPLEAFSRGEQAFAYTRARLAALDRTARNRLIALDEFGAFIAKDRLAKLVQLLNERRAEHPNDQVLLILPVSADYEAQYRTATGAERPHLKRIVDELKAHGYFTEKL